MLRTGRSGFYFSITVEGEVGAGDAVDLVERSPDDLTVAVWSDCSRLEARNHNLLRRAVRSSVLPANWKAYFADRLE